MHMDVTIEMNEDDREMPLHKGKFPKYSPCCTHISYMGHNFAVLGLC